MTAKRSGAKRGNSPKSSPEVSSRSSPRPSRAPSPTAEQGKDALSEYRRKRDFSKTAEPAGREFVGARAVSRPTDQGRLHFVIQKHAASHLHFDLRLEVDGVMKSWAVPKGPSADPTVKRLAMQVEDHPVEYNTFEGTIPQGEYGGGTVMLWDRGTYTVDEATDDTAEDDTSADEDARAHAGFERGDLKITFHGKRMHGSYALVRTKGLRGSKSSKPSWLLIKHRDRYAHPESEYDLVRANMTSVASGRTMEQIRDGAPA